MDTLSFTDICILLLDPDPSSSMTTLALLLDNDYRVVTTFGGADTLDTLQEKKRKVDLVLMSSKLPDMCAVEFLDILKSKYNMAVVIVFDTYQPDAMMEFLQKGAVFCITKPLDARVVARLWHHPIVKETDVLRQLCKSPVSSGVTSKDSEIYVAKDKVEGSFMGLSSSFTWTPSLEEKFLSIVCTLGDYDFAPVEVLRRMSVPGLTLRLVMDKLQEYEERQNSQFNSVRVSPTPAFLSDQNAVDQFMGQDIYPGQEFTCEGELNGARGFNMSAPPTALLNSVSVLPLVPDMSQLPQASVPPANIAQRLVQPPWSSTHTDLSSSSMAPPAPGNGEDGSKRGD